MKYTLSNKYWEDWGDQFRVLFGHEGMQFSEWLEDRWSNPPTMKNSPNCETPRYMTLYVFLLLHTHFVFLLLHIHFLFSCYFIYTFCSPVTPYTLSVFLLLHIYFLFSCYFIFLTYPFSVLFSNTLFRVVFTKV